MVDKRRIWGCALRFATALLVLWAGGSAASGQFQDGPYVSRDSTGTWVARWVENDAASLKVRQQQVAPGREIDVPRVGAVPAFRVRLREPARTASDDVPLPADTPLFVIADTHGELEIAAGLLERHGIVDAALRWSYGKGHLAILGDVFDRGAHHTELLWLIYKLEAEAARAGGGVHLMLGNHEALALLGDERYLHPKYVRTMSALNASRHASLWDGTTVLGQWLRSKAAVMKLGDYLCLHGGISREVVDRGLTLASINRAVREGLVSAETTSHDRLHSPPIDLASFVMGPSGPLWYRGYFGGQAQALGFAPASTSDIAAIRDAYDVNRILVGHTKVPAITPLYDGSVIAVQVYPHRDPVTGAPVMEGLLITNGRLFRARADGSVEPLM